MLQRFLHKRPVLSERVQSWNYRRIADWIIIFYIPCWITSQNLNHSVIGGERFKSVILYWILPGLHMQTGFKDYCNQAEFSLKYFATYGTRVDFSCSPTCDFERIFILTEFNRSTFSDGQRIQLNPKNPIWELDKAERRATTFDWSWIRLSVYAACVAQLPTSRGFLKFVVLSRRVRRPAPTADCPKILKFDIQLFLQRMLELA